MSVKGIRSSLSEADGSKADSLLTFWTRLSAFWDQTTLIYLLATWKNKFSINSTVLNQNFLAAT